MFITTTYRLPRFKSEIKVMTKIPKLKIGKHDPEDEFGKPPRVNIAVFPMVKAVSLPCDLNISDRLKSKSTIPNLVTSNSFYCSNKGKR